MNYTFSNRISTVKPSAIREILKLSSDPSVIAFSAGNPSSESFPKEEISAYTDEILCGDPFAALQYGVTEGYAPLREVLKARSASVYKAYDENKDELIVTTGAQQVLDLLTKITCNEGDTVIAEGPAFVGALSSFKSYGAVVKQVDVGENGMDLDELERAIKEAVSPRFIYCIPNFQNPTGLTMPLEKRKGLLNLASKYGLLILEDNAYGDLRFKGEHLPAIKSMDTEGIVVYAGSMSKLLAPGLRVGFVSAAKEIIAKMTVAKQGSDVHTPMLNQMICHAFLTRSDVAGHIKRVNGLYLHKSELMLSELDARISGGLSYTRPEGGLFIWCTMPPEADMLDFCARAVAKKVAVVPGNAFYADDTVRRQSFRINYSSPSDTDISAGVKILAETLRDGI